MKHQIPNLQRNLTGLKFNFVTFVCAARVIDTGHAESRYAYRIKYPYSRTESFQTVAIKYKAEMTGFFFWYGSSMSNFMKILSALLGLFYACGHT
jgi:hypothetical protein